jgi:5-methyltetrahydropteroyltriglutamate--homocysteine methyltransferase
MASVHELGPLSTYEIGSLAKPEWRVKAIAGQPITERDVGQAREWGERLRIDCEPLIELLAKPQLTPEDKKQIKSWSSLYGVRFLESAGLDVVYDGEQQRSEMYHYPITHCTGFEFRGHVRSFDNKYYQKAACVAEPRLKEPYHVEEFQIVKGHAKKPLKVPITGAYTLVDWSFDEHYSKGLALGSAQARKARKEARRRFLLDVAKHLIRPNLEALVAAGAEWIQIDEPAVTTHPDEIPLFVEAFNESTRGIDCRFTVHICFSDYSLLFPHIDELENCWGLSIGFANYDSRELGTSRAERPGYETLHEFRKLKKRFNVGLGVLDIHVDWIEPPELVRDRILYAVDVLGDPALVCPAPDCGLRTRTWDVAYKKLQSLVEGTQMAKEVLRL